MRRTKPKESLQLLVATVGSSGTMRQSLAAKLRNKISSQALMTRTEAVSMILSDVQVSKTNRDVIKREAEAADSLLGLAEPHVAIDFCLNLFRICGLMTEDILSDNFNKRV